MIAKLKKVLSRWIFPDLVDEAARLKEQIRQIRALLNASNGELKRICSEKLVIVRDLEEANLLITRAFNNVCEQNKLDKDQYMIAAVAQIAREQEIQETV